MPRRPPLGPLVAGPAAHRVARGRHIRRAAATCTDPPMGSAVNGEEIELPFP
jgi:hypothetical protein